MNSRTLAFRALIFASASVLGTQVLSYGLVYPAGSRGTKFPIVLALLLGATLTALCAVFSARAYRNSNQRAERFVSLLGIVISGFFFFVVVVGYGIPTVFLGSRD